MTTVKVVAAMVGVCALAGTPLREAAAQDTAPHAPSTTRPPVRLPGGRSVIDSSEIENIDLRGMDYLGASSRRAMRDSLDAQKRIWANRRPTAYVIRVLTVDHCIHVRTGALGATIPRMVVTGISIVKREEASIPRSYASHCWHEWRVDDLFNDLARALADTSRVVGGIQYDPAYGFPRFYWTAPSPSRPAGVVVESFSPAP